MSENLKRFFVTALVLMVSAILLPSAICEDNAEQAEIPQLEAKSSSAGSPAAIDDLEGEQELSRSLVSCLPWYGGPNVVFIDDYEPEYIVADFCPIPDYFVNMIHGLVFRLNGYYWEILEGPGGTGVDYVLNDFRVYVYALTYYAGYNVYSDTIFSTGYAYIQNAYYPYQAIYFYQSDVWYDLYYELYGGGTVLVP